MLLDLQEEDNSLIVSYFNKEGNVSFKTFDTSNIFNYVVCQDNSRNAEPLLKNWDGRSVRRNKGKSLSSHTITNLLDNLEQKDADDVFGYYFPKIYFFDIETEIVPGYTVSESSEQVPGKVLTISLVTPDQKAIVMGLKDLDSIAEQRIAENINERFKDYNANFTFEFKKFKSEYDMVYTFMKTVSKLPMLSGWYCIGFDWKYLVNRCRKLGIDPGISSPAGILTKQNLPYHVGLVDYKDLYMDWDRSIKIKENGKLETAGKQVLGIGKIDFDGDLMQLYENDYEKYVYYNAVDSVLVYFIDQILKTMQTTLTLSNICKISLYKASSPVAITESILSRNLLAENKVMAQDFDKPENKSTKYEGAFVKEPIKGKHIGVACFDYASLYPSLMRQFNISPDSFEGMTPLNIADDYREKNLGQKIVTASGATYTSGNSILKTVLGDLYSQRRSYKDEYFKFKTMIDEIEHKIKEKQNKI